MATAMQPPVTEAPGLTPAQGVPLEPEDTRAGMTWLWVWMSLMLAGSALLWITGQRDRQISQGVNIGMSNMEAQWVGEQSDDVLRKALDTQRDTYAFWSALRILSDLVFVPGSLLARALTCAVVASAIAALVGRRIGFAQAWSESARLQWPWVLGLWFQIALVIGLRQSQVATSAVLLLPPGTYPAPLLIALTHLDPFALLGWWLLTLGIWRRGQLPLWAAIFVIAAIAVSEACLHISWEITLGAGMRLTIMP